ncbi:MAG: TonB-dependent receptor [Saprospiraceae bacterium]|nr:TonB-dependent receptor [Saprospiraceae bacterium]
MQKIYLIAIFFSFLFSNSILSQNPVVFGYVTDATTGEALIGATVKIGEEGTVSDFNGKYEIALTKGDFSMQVSYVGFETVTREVKIDLVQDTRIDFQLTENPSLLQTVTVTSGRYAKELSEVTVSMEVLKPRLLESVNTTSIDEVLGKIPGVDIIDGQPNIRGGSGFSYGAGSRVLLLLDDMPILQPDAGFPQWDDIPVENIEQIEVVKGAASALYGSSALNGIINIRTAYAKSEPETKISAFYTVFGDPSDKDQVWYTERPHEFGGSISHKQKINKLDLVVGTYYLNRNSFNKSTYNRYWRGNLGVRYRANQQLTYGFNSNFNPGESGNFFFWKGLDSLYVGSDNSISTTERFRFNIDPFLNYFDKNGNRHRIQSRYFYIDNNNNNDQSNSSQTYYAEYQFQRVWSKLDVVTTAGLLYNGNFVNAPLYGDTTFSIRNLAAYLQLEKEFFDRLNVSIGLRYEHYTVNTPDTIRNVQGLEYPIKNGQIVESKPVVRVGANYRLGRATYLRSSWGQGYRFPTIAESFIQTTFGGFPILPNPLLQSETGWSAEIGVKQGFRVGGFEGFVDAAAFWSKYENMMEFNFASLPLFGFQSINVGGTDIKGFECTIAGRGNIGNIPLNLLTGYTYLDPEFQEFEVSSPPAGVEPTEGQLNYLNSSSEKNILKYRYQHTFKFDLEADLKPVRIGFSANYYSFIEAVDRAFESLIVPGLRTYRMDNNKGTMVLGARVSCFVFKEKGKISILSNNLLNKMYSVRPGLMEAPRSYAIRVDWNF